MENTSVLNLEEITSDSRQAMADLLEATGLKPGKIVVVGCSTSEIQGRRIGSSSAIDVADAVIDGILPLIRERETLPGKETNFTMPLLKLSDG